MRILVGKQYKIWLAAASPDTGSRPALQGVLVDPEGWLIAANGFVLVGVRYRREGDWPQREGTIIVPAELFRWAVRSNSPIDIHNDHASIQVKGRLSGEFSVPLITAKYPNWRVLIPKVDDAPRAYTTLDPQLLADVAAAMGAKEVQVWQTEMPTSPYIVTARDSDTFGLIMPIFVTDGVKPYLDRVLALRPKEDEPAESSKPAEGGKSCPAGPESR